MAKEIQCAATSGNNPRKVRKEGCSWLMHCCRITGELWWGNGLEHQPRERRGHNVLRKNLKHFGMDWGYGKRKREEARWAQVMRCIYWAFTIREALHKCFTHVISFLPRKWRFRKFKSYSRLQQYQGAEMEIEPLLLNLTTNWILAIALSPHKVSQIVKSWNEKTKKFSWKHFI